MLLPSPTALDYALRLAEHSGSIHLLVELAERVLALLRRVDAALLKRESHAAGVYSMQVS